MGLFTKMADTVAKKALIDAAGEAVSKTASAVIESTDSTVSTNGLVKLPRSADDYCGQNYEEVEEELQAYGFKNIALLQKKDLLNGWMVKDGTVKEISISGKANFKKGQRFSSMARVVITYHTFRHAPVVLPPISSVPPKQEEDEPSWTEAPTEQSPSSPSPEANQMPQQIKCKNCNGIMELDFDKGVAVCPYCGSTEPIVESDSVKIERMRQKERAERRVREKEEAEHKERKNAIDDFKRKPLSKVILVATFLALLLAVSNFRYRTFASIVMIIAGVVLGFSWLVGAGLAKRAKQHSYIIFAIVGFALLILAFSLG